MNIAACCFKLLFFLVFFIFCCYPSCPMLSVVIWCYPGHPWRVWEGWRVGNGLHFFLERDND